MVDPDRRPSAQEIEELIDLVRRDPSSPAFIDLGEAYLALGRPRDAAKIAGMGLETSPDNLEGRVLLARAYASQHQWKEAQGELLRVVKVDRSNRTGFALLGEVLLRRNDYERAVPVLQHAQNLDPTSPQILSMLKRARNGQALDAPPPVPTPVPPRGETDNGLPIQRSERSRRAQGVPPPPAAPPPAPAPAPVMRAAPMPAPVPVAPPQARTMAAAPNLDAMTHTEPAVEPPPPAPPPRKQKPTAPPPPSNIEGVRPRVVSAARPQNAAAASLRQSAAVGETYLNDLLTGGLLDVAGVRVPDNDFDLRPDRRWGRSTRRAFIFLFVVLVLGIGGGGGWYWWSEKQKAEAIARLQKEAKLAIGNGDFEGLRLGLDKLSQALDKDNSNVLTFAYIVEIGGLKALLYGGNADEIDRAVKTVEKAIQPGEPGATELVLGKAALGLATIAKSEAPGTALQDIDKSLDAYLAKNDADKWGHWLKGRTQLAAGDRKAARASFKGAGDGDDGLVVAMVDYGNLLVDDGKLDEAIAAFDKATAKQKDHPLAVVGKALGRVENAVDVDQALNDLNDKFKDLDKQPRVAAYRSLGMSIGNLSTEDYAKAAEQLTKAKAGTPPGEPRFWARVAWANYVRGDLKSTAEARAKCVWYSNGKKPDDDPPVQLVDAGLLLASGLPEKALDLATKIEGVRSHVLRAYALIDLGKAKDAMAEAQGVLKTAPENLEAKVLLQEGTMMSDEKARENAANELVGLSRKSNSKIASHALGVAYLAAGDTAKAKEALTKAVTDVSEAAPNPFEYRTHTALAEIALAANDLPEAGKHLDESLKLNAGYFPTLALQAKVVLRNNDPDRAMDLLKPIYKESSAVTPSVQLTLAEALITHKGASQADKDQAKQILTDIKDKAPAAEVSRVAALLDPKLPKELGLPEPEAPGGKPAPVVPKRHR